MAAPKRKPIERESALAEIAQLYLRGTSQVEIAARLGVSQPQISYDLAELQRRWQKAALANTDKIKARELAKLDALETEHWIEWERSKNDRTKIVTEKAFPPVEGDTKIEVTEAEVIIGKGEGAVITKEQITIEGRLGDPRYLAGVIAAMERRAKLLGLDAPTKIAPTDPKGENPYSGHSDAELLSELAAILANQAARPPEGGAAGTGSEVQMDAQGPT